MVIVTIVAAITIRIAAGSCLSFCEEISSLFFVFFFVLNSLSNKNQQILWFYGLHQIGVCSNVQRLLTRVLSSTIPLKREKERLQNHCISFVMSKLIQIPEDYASAPRAICTFVLMPFLIRSLSL
jgi:hypothetical protein